ncbi:MAG: BMP family ABC transporter substrate-binding protein [Burkholderiales bacterium]|nr:BMP family ABC transporter substrate-binding protein [Burkholderiales bacterium]
MPAAPIAGILFGSPGAGSFVAAGEAAFARARAALGADIAVTYLDRTDPASRLERLRRVLAARPALVVLHGAQGEALVESLAPEAPRTLFAISQGELTGPNIAAYEVALEQPAYLAGALAGWMTRTGVVGHLSGERVRAGLKGCAAFAAGLGHARADARFVSEFCGAQHDADLAAACVAAQHRQGADIIFTMLGAGRAGAIRQCRELGVRQIGDGIDWCALEPEVFLAAAVAESGWGSFRAVADFLGGSFRPGAHVTVGLEDAQVCRLAIGRGVPDAVRARVAQLAQQLPGGAALATQWD